MPHFPGTIPAVITPFDADLQVDVAGLQSNIAALLEGGVSGIVATGTMGEAGQLTDAERRVVVDACVEACGDRAFVVVGISAGSTAAACANARMAKEAGAKGVMCLPPLNYNGPLHEIIDFYRDVAAAAELPIMAYNNPEASGVDLTADRVAAVAAAVPEVVAVKECSGDARRIAALLGATDLEVLVGGDDWALEGFAAGAIGWVSGVANVVPAECVELQALVEAGRLPEAREVYKRLLPLSRLDMTPKLVQYFKGSLDAKGLHGGAVRGPRQPLSADEAEVLRQAVDALGVPTAA